MSSFKLVIDDKEVNVETLVKAYRFWQKHHLKGGEQFCPLCDSDLEKNDVFVCEVCAEMYCLDDCDKTKGNVCRYCSGCDDE